MADNTASKPTAPIFIVGMNGSGTTMLLDHLNSHSRIYGFPEETRILPYFLTEKDKYGDLNVDNNLQRLWLDMCSAFPFWKINRETPLPVPTDWASRERSPAAIFDYVLSEFAAREHKAVWCEKTPMHALHIELLGEHFPAARFIHAIRDGRDCAASFRRRWGYDPKCTVQRWKKVIRAARAQGEAVQDRYTEVRFESLTTDPEKILREVCSFLQIDFEDSLLSSARRGARVGGIESTVIVPNSEGYKAAFSAGEIAELEALGGRVLTELGYPADDTLGDRDLSPLYVWVRQSLTQIMRIKDIYRRARTARQPLKLIAGRIRTGWTHRRISRE